jgi:hypothetical protein
MTLHIMTLDIMTFITLNTGDIACNDITYNGFYLVLFTIQAGIRY